MRSVVEAATLVLDTGMTARQVAALALLVPALALGAVACGGSGAGTTKTSAAQQRLIEQHWRSGFAMWHRKTQNALDGISVIFSTQAALEGIRKADTRLSASLARFEATLHGCSHTIRSLGPVPEVFATAGRYAMRACKSLEQGEHAVEGVVGSLRHGGGFDTLDPLSTAGDLLSTGQAELTTANKALSGA
jgi:hypothetical protein